MYFDAVLDKNTKPVFNGTPEETLKWLVKNPNWHKRWVCVGETMEIVTETEYLNRK